MSLALWGIGVSKGVAIGPVVMGRGDTPDVGPCLLRPQQIPSEVSRFLQALETAKIQLRELRQRVPSRLTHDVVAVLDVHELMLEDPTLLDDTVQLIYSERCNAEWALQLQREDLARHFASVPDSYLGSRVEDIEQVVACLQHILVAQHGREAPQPTAPAKGAVVVCGSLTPAEALLAHQRSVEGFVLQHGGPMSHAAILLRSLGVPAVVGVQGAATYLEPGELVAVDGELGMVVASPDSATLRHLRLYRRRAKQRAASLARRRDRPAVTRDGIPIALRANIELPGDVLAANSAGADGVGLYRTEFLFVTRNSAPDEDEQTRAYTDVLQELNGRQLTIRTLDLAPDKTGGMLSEELRSSGPLGLRSLRLCLRQPALFLCQLRAILRAAALGPIRMLVPMVTSPQEFSQVKRLLVEAAAQLRSRGVAHTARIPVGCMVEIPAAAVCADLFAARADFLSIGTNDLTQYTLAVDRADEAVSHIYDPLHPAVLRLISHTLGAGERAGIPVSLCGEMAGDPRYTRLLLGMGLREFSMPSTALAEVKEVVRSSRIDRLRNRVDIIRHCEDSGAIPGLVDELNH